MMIILAFILITIDLLYFCCLVILFLIFELFGHFCINMLYRLVTGAIRGLSNLRLIFLVLVRGLSVRRILNMAGLFLVFIIICLLNSSRMIFIAIVLTTRFQLESTISRAASYYFKSS